MDHSADIAEDSYGVGIVIGLDFAELKALASRMHVWAPETPENSLLAQQVKAVSPVLWNEQGITVYYYDPGESAEETFFSLLDTVDLHHGAYSHDPAWSFLQVHGLSLTNQIREALAEYGVTEFKELSDGFVASR